jgi:hypothetical protein
VHSICGDFGGFYGEYSLQVRVSLYLILLYFVWYLFLIICTAVDRVAPYGSRNRIRYRCPISCAGNIYGLGLCVGYGFVHALIYEIARAYGVGEFVALDPIAGS